MTFLRYRSEYDKWAQKKNKNKNNSIMFFTLRDKEDSAVGSQVTYPALSPDSLTRALRASADRSKPPKLAHSLHRAQVTISGLSLRLLVYKLLKGRNKVLGVAPSLASQIVPSNPCLVMLIGWG